MIRLALRIVLLCLSAAILGCAAKPPPENIRTYPLMDGPASLRALADAARRVKTLSGEGMITLTRPDGESVRLDAALAMRPPERARIRAWKFGRAVIDLTVTAEGVWVVAPDDPERRDQIRAAGVGAGKLARTWSVLSGGFFDEPGLTTRVTVERLFIRREATGDAPAVECEVDRRTLTPRRYTLVDDRGAARFSLTLDRYQAFGDVVWPTKLTAVSDGGTVEVELRQVEVNPELPEAAFNPPRRAERLP